MARNNIEQASPMEQLLLFWQWGKRVTAAQEFGEITIGDAAGLLVPAGYLELSGLYAAADLLIVLDTASAIVEGCAYIGAADDKSRD